MRTGHDYPFIGKAGEYAVASQLLLRQMPIYFPGIDTGADLKTENDCRIQVKTARLRLTANKRMAGVYPGGIYVFTLAKKGYRASSKTIRTVPVRPIASKCDVVVFWGVDSNRFWIAPVEMLGDTTNIYLGCDSDRSFEKDMPEMLRMKELGYTNVEIGKHFEIDDSAVYMRFKRHAESRDAHAWSPSVKVRRCENAWHYILDFAPSAERERLSVEEQEKQV